MLFFNAHLLISIYLTHLNPSSLKNYNHLLTWEIFVALKNKTTGKPPPLFLSDRRALLTPPQKNSMKNPSNPSSTKPFKSFKKTTKFTPSNFKDWSEKGDKLLSFRSMSSAKKAINKLSGNLPWKESAKNSLTRKRSDKLCFWKKKSLPLTLPLLWPRLSSHAKMKLTYTFSWKWQSEGIATHL